MTSSFFDITDFGASPDGDASCTRAIADAVQTAHLGGGGTVHVPAGTFRCGPIELKSGVVLDLHPAAKLVTDPDPSAYAAFEKLPFMGFPWIFARGAENIGITGRGTLEGNASQILEHRGHLLIPKNWDMRDGFRVYAVEIADCSRVTLQGFQIRNASFWTLHLRDCENVLIDGVTIRNPVENFCDEEPPEPDAHKVYHTLNADGIDINSCQNVRIANCDIQTSDDAICLKITRDSKKRLCRNVVVTNCILGTDESALKIGSESCGRFEDIVFNNCTINYAGAGIACWFPDGGTLDRWIVSDITMNLQPKVGGNAIYFRVYPREDNPGSAGVIRNVSIRSVRASAPSAVYISGHGNSIENLSLDDVVIDVHGDFWPRTYEGAIKKTDVHVSPPYPMPMWDHKRAPFDIYCEKVGALELSRVSLRWQGEEQPLWGSALRCREVERLKLSGFEGRASKGSERPDIDLQKVSRAEIRGCVSPEESRTVFSMQECGEVVLIGNDFSRSRNLGISPETGFMAMNCLPQ